MQELLARLTDQFITSSNSLVNSSLTDNAHDFPLGRPFYCDFSHDDIIISVLTAMSVDYFRAYVPSMSPREALQPLINKFRALDYINRPPWASTEHELVYEESAFPPPERADFRDESGFESQVRARDEFLAKRHLKDLYLECGWDVNAVEQTAFRRDEFLEKREQYLNTIYKDRLEEIRRRQELYH